MADEQRLADLFAGQAVDQMRGHFAFAGRQSHLDGRTSAQVFKRPNACFVRIGAIHRATCDVTPKSFAQFVAPHASHDPLIGIHALGIQDRCNALPRALVFVHAGVEQLEGLPHQLRARCAKHFAHALVAIDHGAVARQHHAHRCKIKS